MLGYLPFYTRQSLDESRTARQPSYEIAPIMQTVMLEATIEIADQQSLENASADGRSKRARKATECAEKREDDWVYAHWCQMKQVHQSVIHSRPGGEAV